MPSYFQIEAGFLFLGRLGHASDWFCFDPTGARVSKNKEAGPQSEIRRHLRRQRQLPRKFNVFRNDIDGYIDLVASAPVPVPPFGSFSQFFQYQNITHARIEGFEAETLYDAGTWFVGVAGHLIRGKNTETNVGLATITPRKITTTGGVRLLDRRLTISAQWSSFGATTICPPAICRRHPMNWSICI